MKKNLLKYSRFIKAGKERDNFEDACKAVAAGETIDRKKIPFGGLALREVVCGVTGQSKLVGRCPQCAMEGRDAGGKHLVVYPNGKWQCIRFAGDGLTVLPEASDHRSKIWKLAGGKLGGLYKPTDLPPLIKKRRIEQVGKIQSAWVEARAKYAMTMEDWVATSADLPGSPENDFRYYCKQWNQGDLAWVGTRYDSNQSFSQHRFSPSISSDVSRMWDLIESEGLDHASGKIFSPASTNRGKSGWVGNRVAVIEHDDDSDAGQIALTRWLQAQGLRLLCAISTGNRGIHSLFDASAISTEKWQSVGMLLQAIKADAGAFARGNTRCPGAIRQNQHDGKPHGVRQPIVYIPFRKYNWTKENKTTNH
jgi:hypothetical protein